MRAGFAGSQRYGLIPWTGDVSRSWGGLKPQPELSLQMGMQGIAYLHSDLGGFAGGDSLNTELYTDAAIRRFPANLPPPCAKTNPIRTCFYATGYQKTCSRSYPPAL